MCQLCFWPAEYRSTNPRAGIIQSHFPVVCTGTWHVPGPSCATLCFLVGTCHVLVHLVLIHYSKKVLPVRNLSGFWTASSMFGKTCVPTVWLFAVLFLLCVQLVCTSPYIFFPAMPSLQYPVSVPQRGDLSDTPDSWACLGWTCSALGPALLMSCLPGRAGTPVQVHQQVALAAATRAGRVCRRLGQPVD